MSLTNNLLSPNMTWSTMSPSSPIPLPLPSVTPLNIDSSTFPPAITSPASSKKLFLGGAGMRWFDIEGKVVIVTVIGIYLEAMAVPSLSVKWKGKNAKELTESVSFFRQIITGVYEKFIRVTMKKKLTGTEYSSKVAEYCQDIMKSSGKYTKDETKAIHKFLLIFKDQDFPPGSSIFFALCPKDSLTIAFSKDEKVPRSGHAVIENKLLGEAILESMIGKNGVSPSAKKSLAERLSKLMNQHKEANYNIAT